VSQAHKEQKLLNTNMFLPDQENVEKVGLSQGYWNPQRKLGLVVNFSEIISFEP